MNLIERLTGHSLAIREEQQMNKTELVNAIAEKSDLAKKDADCALNALLDVMTDTLKQDDKVQLIGFGTFEVKECAPRRGRNPQTQEEIEIPASRLPVFKAGKILRDSIRNEEM